MGSRNLIAETSFIERRLKYVVIVLSTIFVLNILAFIFLEGLNLLDAIYFTIITITTVGYGDITPENPVTKILLILLLITTLTIVATISEFVIDRVVARRESRLYLPAGGVGWKKHAIIADITPLSLDIARTLQTRFIDVLLLDQDSEKVIGARNQGYNAFIGDIAEEENVHKLNLEEADVIFLFRSTNESLLKTTIILRAESESIPIYALTPEHELEQEFAQQVGISRVYSYPRLIASTISLMTRDIKVAVFANQPERDANYYYAIVRPSSFANVQQYLGDHLVLGVFNFTTLSFYNHLSPEFTDHVNSIDTPESDEYGFLTVFPKTNADNLKLPHSTLDNEQIEIEGRFDHVIIFGFDDQVQEMIGHLRVPTEGFVIVTFDEQQKEAAVGMGMEAVYLKDEAALAEYVESIHSDDVVYNLIDELELALKVTIAIRKREDRIPINQLINDRYEAELFRRFDVQSFVNAEMLTLRAMAQIYLRTKNYSLSSLYTRSHVFEYTIREGSPILGLTMDEVGHMGYTVLFHSSDERKFNPNQPLPPLSRHLQMGDVVFLESSR